jgi:hypothetical protein
MLKIVHNLLLNAALVLIVLHTFIPHPHSEGMVNEEHIHLHNKSHSFYGILKLIFHENNDESLDSLLFAEYNSILKEKQNIQFLYVFSNHFRFIKIEKQQTHKNINVVNNHFYIVTTNGVRGPPEATV